MGHNRIGAPCSVGRLTAHAPACGQAHMCPACPLAALQMTMTAIKAILAH